MPNDNQRNRLELVESLASSIQKKLLEPAEDRVELVNCAIKDLRGQVAGLEQKVALLTVRHGRTRLMASVSFVAAILLALGQIFLLIR